MVNKEISWSKWKVMQDNEAYFNFLLPLQLEESLMQVISEKIKEIRFNPEQSRSSLTK